MEINFNSNDIQAERPHLPKFLPNSFNVGRCLSCGFEAATDQFKTIYNEAFELGLNVICPFCGGDKITVVLIKKNK